MLGKHVRDDFSRNDHRYKEILYLVHLDVYGLISIESIIETMHCVSFIDDFSCKTWIYFLRTKDGVFSRF